MDPIAKLKQLLDGDLSEVDASCCPIFPAEPYMVELCDLEKSPETLAALQDLGRECLSLGQVLRALTVLKITAALDYQEADVLPLMEEALQAGLDSSGQPDTSDPLAREFLATERTDISWCIIRGDQLKIVQVPVADLEFGANAWLICVDANAGQSQAPHGLAIVWWNTTPVAGRLRPAGRRHGIRRKIPLQLQLTLLGGGPDQRSGRKVDTDLLDLSESGMGLSVPDPYGLLDVPTLKGNRVRVELADSDGRPVSTLAIIMWGRIDREAPTHRVILGCRFDDPPPDFTRAVEELLVHGKSDQQYLWNLWASQVKKS
jgi:hypothetical protein